MIVGGHTGIYRSSFGLVPRNALVSTDLIPLAWLVGLPDIEVLVRFVR